MTIDEVVPNQHGQRSSQVRFCLFPPVRSTDLRIFHPILLSGFAFYGQKEESRLPKRRSVMELPPNSNTLHPTEALW